jgi:hypothetical protein
MMTTLKLAIMPQARGHGGIMEPYSLRRAGRDLDAPGREHGVEGAGELARAVPDQEPK